MPLKTDLLHVHIRAAAGLFQGRHHIPLRSAVIEGNLAAVAGLHRVLILRESAQGQRRFVILAVGRDCQHILSVNNITGTNATGTLCIVCKNHRDGIGGQIRYRFIADIFKCT